jgi:chromate transporter
MRFGDLALVKNLFYGIKPAVVAIVAHAAYRIGARTLSTPLMWGIASGSFIAIFFMNIPFPVIVAVAALLSFLFSQYRPQWFNTTPSQAAAHVGTVDHPIVQAKHTQFSWRGLVGIVACGLLLWAIPMAALTLYFGWDHTLTQMSWFFTKAALLTFGGAYAVLPYVYQGAVLDYQWVSAVQMIDSLALGETTPGPLIMVVAFVGFIGAYVKALFGPDALFLAGASAALLITWFTFLPSFIFILAGGPLIESTHNKLEFTAPLSAITAAVVGVIINLGLFFAYHVGWPNGFGNNALAHVDPVALGIASLATVALFKYRVNLIVLIASCAGLGVLLKTAW